ncbi:MAG: family 43 glycosylhydrolase [Bacilli bacterium]|nr:family 43 glycosylhydrolase [Bacilli bacterium]
MKKNLVIVPLVSSFLFMYGCGPTPHTDQPTAYQFTFEGTNCNIEYEDKYETKIYEGDKNLTFTINPEYDFVLIQSDVEITGKNTTYDEVTHKITISEVVGDVIVTADATTKPSFTFHGENCNIGGIRDITDKPLKKGDKNVEFSISVDSGYALGKDDLKIEGENVDYNPASQKIIISEVVGPVNITAKAYTLLKFSFTGTNCNIDGNSRILAKEIKKGDKNVKFSVNVDYGYFLNDQKVEVTGKNATYDDETKTITISEVTTDVEVSATADSLVKHTVTGTLSNCHFYEDPKQEGYIVGSKVKLKFIPDKDTTHIYGMPELSNISGLSEYTYDSETGMLTFEMPDTDVSFTATSTATVNILHITNDYQIVYEGEDARVCYHGARQINDARRYHGEKNLTIVNEHAPSTDREIILTDHRSESQELAKELRDNDDYIIKVANNKIIFAYRTNFARICAVDRLLTDFLYEDGIDVPTGLEVRGACKKEDYIVDFLPDGRKIRDPFIYRDGTNYYMYGTCGSFDGDKWSVYGAKDTFKSGWKLLNEDIVDESQYPFIDTYRWAPELHKYGDNYYLFTTYVDKSSNQGTVIFKSKSLTEGFEMISTNPDNGPGPGHIVSHKIVGSQCGGIDGTLYVKKMEDGKEQPYLIHCYGRDDRTCNGLTIVPFKTDPGIEPLSQIREMESVKLVDGDTYVPWRKQYEGVFEGQFIRKLKDGSLVMIASSFDPYDKYCVGIVCNKYGDKELTNPYCWEQQERLLYAKDICEGASDGGHAMIFDDPDGNLYLCFHNNNSTSFENPRACIVPIKEAYGTLVWDLYNHTPV